MEHSERVEAALNTIVNLGNPREDFAPIARVLMGATAQTQTELKITGASIFLSKSLCVTSALYGAGMVVDGLEEMWCKGFLSQESRVIFIGSMGSISPKISVGQVVVPNPCLCAYYDFDGITLWQDKGLLASFKSRLQAVGHESPEYCHGSSFAVYDPHTNHSTYTTSLYTDSVLGLDCGEVFVGFEFAVRKNLMAAAALYCSDDPKTHISDIGYEKFDELAAKRNLELNAAAADALVR